MLCELPFFQAKNDKTDSSYRRFFREAWRLLSASRMLQHLGEHTASRALEAALAAVIKEGKHTTPDLGGAVGTQQMAAAIANRIQT